MRFRRALLLAASVTAPSAVIAACGARTPLLVPDLEDAEAGTDARRDARRDALPDVPIPPIDSTPLDAYRNDCPDADATLVYVVTSDGSELLSFFPPGGSFKKIGNITCPATMGATPFSMGVDRKGIARVLYSNGEIFRVSTANASCMATPFKGDSIFGASNGNFGMAYATIGAGPMEDLFIIANTGELGKVDFVNNKPVKIGDTQPNLPFAELTGTGDGRLYAFYRDDNVGGSGIAELDKSNAKLLGADPLKTLDMGNGWAFAFWGGDFYLFTGTGTSVVNRYRPSNKSLVQVATYNGLIVGAGVSTCAPSQ